MQRIVLALFTCFAVAAAGCSSSSTSGGNSGGSSPAASNQGGGGSGGKSVVGIWEGTDETPDMSKVAFTFELTADGKAKMSVVIGKDAMPAMEGTYKHAGDKLTINVKKADMADAQTFTIKELTETKMTLSDPGKKDDLKLTRKK